MESLNHFYVWNFNILKIVIEYNVYLASSGISIDIYLHANI